MQQCLRCYSPMIKKGDDYVCKKCGYSEPAFLDQYPHEDEKELGGEMMTTEGTKPVKKEKADKLLSAKEQQTSKEKGKGKGKKK